MNLAGIQHGKIPMVIKYSNQDSPHLTIETNRTCNIKCRSCYNLNNTFVKDYAQIKSEIDKGLEKRNIISLSLIGGEPTLHPNLLEIIRYVKSKNVQCQLLTNGIRFLDDEEDTYLK
jgi:MoaA/NifB/PqqE/SkfB family radical SAM enzyme